MPQFVLRQGLSGPNSYFAWGCFDNPVVLTATVKRNALLLARAREQNL
jgi:hypothetical protein